MASRQELSTTSFCFLPLLFCIALILPSTTGYSEDSATENTGDEASLAMKLQNPVASLISVPFQNNVDFGAGPDGDGVQWKLNIQPVVPISISEDWNLISRTILPVVYQENIIGTTSQGGLSDTTQSFFFSPTAGGLIWGAGPVFLFPTATDDLLGTEKWGAGPTAILLKQEKGWTYGALVNHIWSFAGDDSRSEVNQTFLQPFLGYTTTKKTSFFINSESTYNWHASQWTIPINVTVSQLVNIGKQPVQFQVGGRYYPEAPENGPEWGLRFTVTLLFPN